MQSPFPGMDPYLESPAFWSDFHSTFINLGEVFATTYERGRFGRRIDYHQSCPAPLSPEHRAWVESRLK